jgi:acetyl esterase/lipase
MKILAGVSLPLLIVCLTAGAADVPRTLELWPGRVPGETVALPPEADVSKPDCDLVAGRRVIVLSNVSHPTITIYRPEPTKDTGAAMLVCPGGGYWVLAMDLEGTEACEWLNSIGVTAILLKYRVPVTAGKHPESAPLQDAQRALGLVRAKAQELNLDPQRIGILGFSAGAYLAAILSNNHSARTYPVVDAADQFSCRPDFCVLIYPGDLTLKDRHDQLIPELPVSHRNTPPTFLAMAEDDSGRVETALFYYLALKNEKIPAELHLYPNGGHGYGLRRTAATVTTWPDRVTDWMKASGWLKAPTTTR